MILTRRALLTTAPAAAALPAYAVEGSGIMTLFRQWLAMTDKLERLPVNTSDADLDRAYAPRDRLEERLMALPSITAADFAAKIIIDSAQGAVFSDWETGAIWSEARRLTCHIG
ncbi:hypothetical protein [Pseudodonghicola sp.]|uniref:hypothetical protein n=1 Tax=Pseudodonghicola sp. TaxID=1969463 RepID=UPI003A97C9E9